MGDEIDLAMDAFQQSDHHSKDTFVGSGFFSDRKRVLSPKDKALRHRIFSAPMLERIQPNKPLTLEPQGICENLGHEYEMGFIEYKYKLIDCSERRREHLTTQMNFRLTEGAGEAVYELGVLDDGEPVGIPLSELATTIRTVAGMAQELRCECFLIHVKKGRQGLTAELLLQRYSRLSDTAEVRICVAGNADSGKSTLIGVLASGQLDNGRGSARMHVFRHRHELADGRTSSLSRQLVGFDREGRIVNHSPLVCSWQSVVENSETLVTFIDLAGHNRYVKTAMFGLASQEPDYALIAISATSPTLPEHLALSLALNMRVIIVITKTDCCSPEQISHVVDLIRLATSQQGETHVLDCDDTAELQRCVDRLVERRIVPVLLVSSTTGQGRDQFERFVRKLPKSSAWPHALQKPTEFSVDEVMFVMGVGTVLTGTVRNGFIEAGQCVQLGPDDSGAFRSVTVGLCWASLAGKRTDSSGFAQVTSVHVLRRPVRQALAGQAASVALREVDRDTVRKGMYLVHAEHSAGLSRTFDARLTFIDEPTTTTGTAVEATLSEAVSLAIHSSAEFVVHVGSAKALASIIDVHTPPEPLPPHPRPPRLLLTFRLVQRPLFISPGTRLVVRDSRVRGAGIVTRVAAASLASNNYLT